MRFLLIEDDPDHAEIMTFHLKRELEGCEVEHVADGFSALDYLYQQGDYQDRASPDLILLDLKLPGFDGHEILSSSCDRSRGIGSRSPGCRRWTERSSACEKRPST